jgi:hypothetical protein
MKIDVLMRREGRVRPYEVEMDLLDLGRAGQLDL